MFFVRCDTNVFSYRNLAKILSTCRVMGYSTTTPINKKKFIDKYYFATYLSDF